uniref:NADH-ubiquinone oxidoreductase chain 1 n=1 Tax=Eurytoma sp. TJS-2016 TaxID=1855182 RepID=A0A1X9HXL3_9HYME|nr:NADH dehydrogenase subunit 1 [Eurytoma sp. TJS-2016]
MIFLLNSLNSLLISLNLMIMVLISVAFFTLLERKVLGYIQIRKGPNKVGFLGLLQPFSDAIKLFSKETFLIFKSNYLYYLISPIMSMLIMLMLWQNLPMLVNILNNLFGMLMILCIMSVSVYGVMIAGWSSNSMYSLIGGVRSIAQTISYEVSMILLMLSEIILIESFNLMMFKEFQVWMWMIFMNLFLSIMLFVSFMAELNRTPFDFAEGESELVSGFNTEYMSGSFALIFIAEYGMIMFMMMLFSIFFLGGNLFKVYFYLVYLLMMFMVIWIRGTFPRFRYDNLMYLIWKSYLPISLNLLILMISLKFLI